MSWKLKVKILESDIVYVNKGHKAEVYPFSGSGMKALQVPFISINPKVDESGLYRSPLPSTKPEPASGMNARSVIRHHKTTVWWYPKEAVVYRPGRPVVFTIDNNEAIWNLCRSRQRQRREMEILDGLVSPASKYHQQQCTLAHQARVQGLTE